MFLCEKSLTNHWACGASEDENTFFLTHFLLSSSLIFSNAHTSVCTHASNAAGLFFQAKAVMCAVIFSRKGGRGGMGDGLSFNELCRRKASSRYFIGNTRVHRAKSIILFIEGSLCGRPMGLPCSVCACVCDGAAVKSLCSHSGIFPFELSWIISCGSWKAAV